MIERTTYILYCPRGCQVFHGAPADQDECGNCGAIMTTDDSDYNDFHDWYEAQQIAEFERTGK